MSDRIHQVHRLKLLILFISLSMIKVLAFASECRSNRRIPLDWTPDVLRSYVSNSRAVLNNPGDLICCMAERFDMEIAIAHSSEAAQNSNADHPKILTIFREISGNIKGIMTFNSPGLGLLKTNAVELMFNNQQTEKLEFYDIEFHSAGHTMSRPNPAQCTVCHAPNPANTSDPRALFDNAPWPRFANPTPLNRLCPVTNRLRSYLEERSTRAISSNYHYRCIKNAKLASVENLSRELEQLNSKRVARLIRATPNYDKYKYAIIAFEMCREWQPFLNTSLYDSINNATSLPANIRDMSELGEFTTFIHDAIDEQRVQTQVIENLNGSFLSDLRPDYLVPATYMPFVCRPDSTPYKMREFDQNNVLLNQFTVHSFAQGGDPNFGFYRYMFETRGLNISDWSMIPDGYYGKIPQPLWPYLVDLELPRSPLRALLGGHGNATINGNVTFGVHSLRSPVCQELLKISQTALQ